MQKYFNQIFTKSRLTNSNMKFLIVLSVALACAAADVSYGKDEASAPVVRSSYDINPEGNFQYAYETGNGISAQADGVVKNPNSEYPALAITGAFRYTAPDGTPVETSYVADEEGFKPVGSHIPVAPPLPEPIARALAYIAAHPPSENAYKPPTPAYKPPTPAYKPPTPTYG